MYTKIRKSSIFVLCLILVFVVTTLLLSGCASGKPLTNKEKMDNYWKNVKDQGHPKNTVQLASIIILAIAVGTVAIALALSKDISKDKKQLMPLPFEVAVSLCVGVIFLCGMESCTEDSILTEPVLFLETEPSNGSEIVPNSTIIARFDGEPTDLRVSTGTVAVKGETAEINGPFTPGILNLTLTWADDDDAVVSFTVKLPGPGEVVTFHSNAGQTTMVLIPEGNFQMGSNDDPDPKAFLDTAPVHTVYVDAFYMDTHEVTNLQWHKFITENPEWQKDNIDEALRDGFYLEHWNGNNYPLWKEVHPVTNVSWYAAMAYAQWSGGKRLPTEAEWEKAARGQLAGKLYPWGDSIDATKANYNFNMADTRDVGRYSPNAYGLYDMSGNVWEWVLDEAISDFYTRSPLRNPIAGSNLPSDLTTVKTARVMRGGSFYSAAEDTTVTVRGGKHPSSCLGSVGFRCAKDVSR